MVRGSSPLVGSDKNRPLRGVHFFLTRAPFSNSGSISSCCGAFVLEPVVVAFGRLTAMPSQSSTLWKLSPDGALIISLAAMLGYFLSVLLGRLVVHSAYGISVFGNTAIFVGAFIAVLLGFEGTRSMVSRRRVQFKGPISAAVRFGLGFSANWYAFMIWFYNWPSNLVPEQPLDYEDGPSTVIALSLVAVAICLAVSVFIRLPRRRKSLT